MLLASQNEIGLHCAAECVHMTVGMLPWQHILSLSQRPEIKIVLKKTHREFAIAIPGAALISQEKILRQRVGFVPTVGLVLLWDSVLFRASQGLARKMWQYGVRRGVQHLQSYVVAGALMRIDQPATGFVVGIRRQMVVDVKLRCDGRSQCADEAVYFCLRLF